MGGAAFALFSDQATSNDNTFSSGNADLVIANDVPPGNPDTYADSVAGVSVTDMVPGQVETKDFWLKNDSSGSFSMDLTVDLDDLQGSDTSVLVDELMVMFTCDTDNNGLGDGTDTSTAEKSVQDWLDDLPVALGSVGANQVASNATTDSDQDELICRMTATLPEDSDNDAAGKDLSFDGLFNGIQVAP
ncbi:MAG: hypothetical protein A2860_00650 [Candidatus Levybacteria bacterium RIFCSPHIGHO2_01_FULL_37_33]|nr:MAG: hypothetical protein A2860_00650 [Candidatus Levybacteria bacterium RIFCSPHIGHO2_01_FULL_37_33]OGH30084.1 MAG: hypothetical protein A3F30_03870 [Candidatus Levybacteria bacterium RIFCSPHIGHO2_12_FULL_37_12]